MRADRALTFRNPQSGFSTRFSGHPLQESRMRRLLVSALAVLASPLSAQSLLFRSPNLSGTWVSAPGVVQFNFLHRFYVFPASAGHFVVNSPTFTLTTGVVQRVAVGAWFATRSPVGS